MDSESFMSAISRQNRLSKKTASAPIRSQSSIICRCPSGVSNGLRSMPSLANIMSLLKTNRFSSIFATCSDVMSLAARFSRF